MNHKIKVSYKYVYANPIKRTIVFRDLVDSIIQTKALYIQRWLETDDIYDPNNYFKITKLKLNKDKRIEFIELTEMENNINE